MKDRNDHHARRSISRDAVRTPEAYPGSVGFDCGAHEAPRMSSFLPPSLKTCDGSQRWSLTTRPGHVHCVALELRRRRQGRWIKAGRSQRNARPSIASSRLLQQNLPKDGVIGRPSLWIAENFGCCASG
jgi:hypothetical protein